VQRSPELQGDNLIVGGPCENEKNNGVTPISVKDDAIRGKNRLGIEGSNPVLVNI